MLDRIPGGIGIDDAVVSDAAGYADKVPDVGFSGLVGFKDRRQIGDIALDVPRGAKRGARFGGRTVVNTCVA